MSNQPFFTEQDHKLAPNHFAQLNQWFPWLRMFRAFRIAIDYQKLAIGLLALLLWFQGSERISLMLLNDDDLQQRVFTTQPQGPQAFRLDQLSKSLGPLLDRTHQSALRLAGESQGGAFEEMSRASMTVIWPFERVTRSLLDLLGKRGSKWWWHAWMQLLWGLGIAAVFGTTICRMTGRELTGSGRALVRDTRFAIAQVPATFGAPLAALGAFLLLWLLGLGTGLLGRIPVLGELLVALAWAMLFLWGLLMALLLLGVAVGWPLMYAASAIERSDALDSLSRAFSYLLNRPWYTLFLTGLAVYYGAVLMWFVSLLTRFAIACGLGSVAAGRGVSLDWRIVPPSYPSLLASASELFDNPLAIAITEFWIGLGSLVPGAFGFSFFWSSVTLAYFLLRRREDGTPFEVIDLSDDGPGNGASLPLVGIPAAERREAQLATQGDSADSSDIPPTDPPPEAE